jgi:hypothetical protein
MTSIYKYLLVALAAIAALSSCSDNLDVDNSPAIQAVRNGEFFKSNRFSATNNADGSLTIVGQNPLETVEFNLESGSVGTYRLGAGSDNVANYTFNGAERFSTSVGNGNGEVQISSVDNSGVTGTFSFVSYLPNNADSLYMRRGVIFKVPFGNPLGDGGGGSTNDQFAATIDGTALNPTVITASSNSGTLVIGGSNGGSTISIVLAADTAVGTYDLAGSSSIIATYIAGGTPANAISGTLVVTAADQTAETISGTFDFMTGPPNNFEITNGSFNVTY